MDVKIDFSSINQVLAHGINVNVRRLSITDSMFMRLAPGSLSIPVRDSITLDRVRIGRLERGALTGLRTAEDAGGPAALTVSGLRVTVAQPGSLAFDASVSVCLSELRIGDRRRPCPVEPLVRQLVGGDDGRPLSAAQLQVHRQLRRPAVCAADRRPPASDGSPEPDCDTDQTTAAATGPYPAVVAILALPVRRAAGCPGDPPSPQSGAPPVYSPHTSAAAVRGARQRATPWPQGIYRLTWRNRRQRPRGDRCPARHPLRRQPLQLNTAAKHDRESQGAAAAVSGGLPPSCAGLYAEVGGKDLLPSPGTDDRSRPSPTGDGPEAPALPPVTMERLQVPSGGQEAGSQEAGYQEVGYQEVGYHSAGL